MVGVDELFDSFVVNMYLWLLSYSILVFEKVVYI